MTQHRTNRLTSLPLVITAMAVATLTVYLGERELLRPAYVFVLSSAARLSVASLGATFGGILAALLALAWDLVLFGLGWAVGYLLLLRWQPSSSLAQFTSIFLGISTMRLTGDLSVESLVPTDAASAARSTSIVLSIVMLLGLFMYVFARWVRQGKPGTEEQWQPFDTVD